MAKKHDDVDYSEYGETTPPAERAARQSDKFSPSSPRADCDGVPVNSPLNKPRVRYDKAESLNIHRSPSVADSHLSKLRRGK